MANKEVHQPRKAEPRFFYGYIVVGVAFLILLVSFGLHSAFGVFFKALLGEFGWTRAMVSSPFSVSMIAYGVLGMVVGGLNDRFGPRVVLTVCGVLIGLGYLLMSQTNALWQLYLFFGVIVGVGMSGVWVPQLSSVARWFVRRRSLMTGIVTAGAGIGQVIIPPVVSRLIAAYDWRLAYVILGSIILLFVVIAAQFLKRDPAQIGLSPYGASESEQPGFKSETEDFSFREAVSTAQFWLAFLMLFCFGYGFCSLLVHIVPHATDLGTSVVSAANILAVMGGVSIIGNYVLGGAGDRIGNRKVFIIGFIVASAASWGLVPARELWMVYLLATVLGFANGGMGAVESPLVAWLFGLRSHGLIYGVVHIGFTAGAAVGPIVTGYIFDLTGSYQVAFLVCAIFGVIGITFSVILRPTKRLETVT